MVGGDQVREEFAEFGFAGWVGGEVGGAEAVAAGVGGGFLFTLWRARASGLGAVGSCGEG